MSYTRALAGRRNAVARCRAARSDLDASVHAVIAVYHAHPFSTLAGASGIGFVLAQLQVGSGLIRAGVRIASGPAWKLVRQYLSDLP